MPAPAARSAGVGVVVLATVAVISPTLRGYFIGDDFEELLGAGDRSAASTTTTHPGRNLRPLNQALHALTTRWFGTSPLPHHLVALALHLAVAGCVAWLMWEIGARCRWRQRARETAAWLAGGAFVLHPSHTEAVSWISARSDLLMSLGLVTCLAAWLRSQRVVHARSWTTIAVLGAVVGMASKEPAVTIPLVAVVVDLAVCHPVEGALRRVVRRSWPLWLVLAAYIAVRSLALGTVKAESWSDEFIGGIPLPRLAAKWLVAVARSLLPQLPAVGWAVAAITIAGTLTVVAVSARRTRGPADAPWWRLPLLLVAAASIHLAPVAKLGVASDTLGGDRFAYFPTALLACAVVATAGRSLGAVSGEAARSPLAWVGVTLSLVALGIPSLWAAQRRWQDAAAQSEARVISAVALERDTRTLVLNMPDSMDGAQIGRNALGHDLVFAHGWRDAYAAEAASTYEVDPVNRGVDVALLPPRRLRVRLAGTSHFLEHAGAGQRWAVEGVHVGVVDARTIDVTVDADAAALRPGGGGVWVVDDARLRRVLAPG